MVAAIQLPVGEYKFKGTTSKGTGSKPLDFIFTVEAGGIISSHPSDAIKYSLNGIIQDGKVTFKQQFEDVKKEVEFDGVFESESKIKGIYKTEDLEEHDAQGSFELVK